MQLLGHELVPYSPLYKVKSIEDISKTPAQSTVIISFDEFLIKHCQENGVPFALHVNNKNEAIIANAAGALLLLIKEDIAKEVQALADHYLFDAKVALCINQNLSLEKAIELGVDMAIFDKAIIQHN